MNAGGESAVSGEVSVAFLGGAIRKALTLTGAVTTIAGGAWGYGAGTAAQFVGPSGITLDNLGNLFLKVFLGGKAFQEVVVYLPKSFGDFLCGLVLQRGLSGASIRQWGGML